MPIRGRMVGNTCKKFLPAQLVRLEMPCDFAPSHSPFFIVNETEKFKMILFGCLYKIPYYHQGTHYRKWYVKLLPQTEQFPLFFIMKRMKKMMSVTVSSQVWHLPTVQRGVPTS